VVDPATALLAGEKRKKSLTRTTRWQNVKKITMEREVEKCPSCLTILEERQEGRGGESCRTACEGKRFQGKRGIKRGGGDRVLTSS